MRIHYVLWIRVIKGFMFPIQWSSLVEVFIWTRVTNDSGIRAYFHVFPRASIFTLERIPWQLRHQCVSFEHIFPGVLLATYIITRRFGVVLRSTVRWWTALIGKSPFRSFCRLICCG